MFVVVGSPQGCLEHVSVAGRPLRCDVCVDTSLFSQVRPVQNTFPMFTRYPSAILRHGLDHGGRDTPATIVLKPRMLGNNADLGSQTATHLAGNSPVASWGEGVAVVQDKTRSRSPRRRPVRGFCGFKTVHTNSNLRRLWREFPPARPTTSTRSLLWNP